MKSLLLKLKTLFLDKNLLLVAIILFSAFLRLYRIQDYMTFLGDEGRDVLVVYGILHGKLTLLGPAASVGGFFLGPIYYYLMAPFLWITNYNPVGPAIMVALFGVATVYLLYKFANEFFGRTIALYSAFLYSISPLVIAYSRSSWNPNLMPFFSLATLFVLYKSVTRKDYRLFLLAGFLLGITMQLHYLAFFLGAIMFAYILFVNLTLNKFILRSFAKSFVKENLLIFGGFLVGLLPFLAFEIRHGFTNILSILRFVFRSGETGTGFNIFSNIYDVFFRFFGRLVAKYPPPEQSILYPDVSLKIWYFAILAFALLSTFILFRSLLISYKKFKKTKDSTEYLRYLLLSVWFVLGIGLFGFYKKQIYDYYFGFMFILPFILVSLTLYYLSSKNLVLKALSVLIFLSLIVINLSGIPFRYEPNRQVDQVKKISDFVLKVSDGKPFNFALIAGGNSDHAYRYFFTLEGRPPVTLVSPANDPERKTVTDQLLIICEMECHPLGHSLWEIAGFGRAEISDEWAVSVVKVYKLVHYKGK